MYMLQLSPGMWATISIAVRQVQYPAVKDDSSHLHGITPSLRFHNHVVICMELHPVYDSLYSPSHLHGITSRLCHWIACDASDSSTLGGGGGGGGG